MLQFFYGQVNQKIHTVHLKLDFHSKAELAVFSANKQTLVHRITKTIFFLFFISVFKLGSADSDNRQYLTLGVIPIVSTNLLVARFQPLAQHLTQILNIPVRLETAPDFEQFLDRSMSYKNYDILITAPHFYLLAKRNGLYQVVASMPKDNMRAIIVTKKKSTIESITDLKGKNIAATAPTALSTLLIKKALAQLQLDNDFRIINTPTHNASIYSLTHGVVDASILMRPIFDNMQPKLRDSLKIVYESDVVPNITISLAHWLNSLSKKNIKNALKSIDTSKFGRLFLKTCRCKISTNIVNKTFEELEWTMQKLILNDQP